MDDDTQLLLDAIAAIKAKYPDLRVLQVLYMAITELMTEVPSETLFYMTDAAVAKRLVDRFDLKTKVSIQP